MLPDDGADTEAEIKVDTDGPPALIGVIGIATIAAAAFLLWGDARSAGRSATLLAAWTAAVIVHLGAMAVTGASFGAAIRRATLGGGGAVCRVRAGPAWLSLGWLPIGGSVQFADQDVERARTDAERRQLAPGSFARLTAAQRIAIAASGPLLLLALAAALLGPAVATDAAARLPLAIVALAREAKLDADQVAAPSLAGLVRLLDAGPSAALVGRCLIVAGLFNLLPLPLLNGGFILSELAGFGRVTGAGLLLTLAGGAAMLFVFVLGLARAWA